MGDCVDVFVQMAFFKKLQNTICFRKAKKTRIFVDTICWWKMSSFCDHTKSPNTTKIGVSAGTGETQNGTFGLKGAILGKGLEKGFYYL